MQILVLTEKVEGGEWIATKRLTDAVSKFFPEFKFYFLAFGKDIKHASDYGFLGFLRAFIFDLKSAEKAIEEKINKIGTVDYVISTNYIFLLASFCVKEMKNVKKIFYFLGLKSLPFNSFKDINHRQIFFKIFEKCSLLLSDHLITNSPYSKEYVNRYIWPLGFLKKVFIVPNSVPDYFYRIITKNKKNNNTILYSGRIAPRKGLDNLIRGFYEFSKRNKNAALLFCYPKSSADGKLLDTLKEYVQKFKISKKVFFKTDLNSYTLKKIYAGSALTILPSEIEMGPLSVIESLACKTPAMGTRVGNIPQILNQIDPRLILKNNSLSEIANKLSWFFDLTLDELESIRKKGYKVSKSYSSLNSAKKFVEILELLK